MTAMGKPEAAIENYLTKQAKRHGYICWKFISPSTDGVPDRILIGANKTIFVETKAPHKDLRKLQKTIARQMQSKGAVVFKIDSKEQVDLLINAMVENKTIDNNFFDVNAD